MSDFLPIATQLHLPFPFQRIHSDKWTLAGMGRTAHALKMGIKYSVLD